MLSFEKRGPDPAGTWPGSSPAHPPASPSQRDPTDPRIRAALPQNAREHNLLNAFNVQDEQGPSVSRHTSSVADFGHNVHSVEELLQKYSTAN